MKNSIYLIILAFFSSCSKLGLMHGMRLRSSIPLQSDKKGIVENYITKNNTHSCSLGDGLINSVSNGLLDQVKLIVDTITHLIKDPHKMSPTLSKKELECNLNNALRCAIISHKQGIGSSSARFKILDILLACDYVDIQAVDHRGNTILDTAVQCNNQEAVKEILKFAKSRLSTKCYRDFLQIKSKIAHPYICLDILLAYLESPGVDIQAVDNKGRTLLHLVVEYGNLEAIKQILKFAKSKLSAEDYKKFINMKTNTAEDGSGGFSALHYAIDAGNTAGYSSIRLQILRFLLASPFVDIQAVDNDGKTILHSAVISIVPEYVEEILKFAKSKLSAEDYKKFINMKTNIAQDGSGACPAIFFAIDSDSRKSVREKSLRIFKLLLNLWNINETDNEKHTISHWAAMNCREDMVDDLVNSEADFTRQDNKSRKVLTCIINQIYSYLSKGPNARIRAPYHKYCALLKKFLTLQPSNIGFDKKNNYGNEYLLRAKELKLPSDIIESLQQKAKEGLKGEESKKRKRKEQQTLSLKRSKPLLVAIE